jgi:hypothetical protein
MLATTPVAASPIKMLETRSLAAYPREMAKLILFELRRILNNVPPTEANISTYFLARGSLVKALGLVRTTPQAEGWDAHDAKAPLLQTIVHSALKISSQYFETGRKPFWEGSDGKLLRLNTKFLEHPAVEVSEYLEKGTRMDCSWCRTRRVISQLHACGLCGEFFCKERPCLHEFHSLEPWHNTEHHKSVIADVSQHVTPVRAEIAPLTPASGATTTTTTTSSDGDKTPAPKRQKSFSVPGLGIWSGKKS